MRFILKKYTYIVLWIFYETGVKADKSAQILYTIGKSGKKFCRYKKRRFTVFLKNNTYFVIVRNLRNMSETSIIFYITASYNISFH